MNQQELFQYSIDDYRAEVEECDRFFSRAALYLGGVPVIGAVGYALCSEVGLPIALSGWPAFFAWSSVSAGGLTLALAFVAGLCLGVAVNPRGYQRNLRPSQLLQFRADYGRILEGQQYPLEHRERAQEEATHNMMLIVTSKSVDAAHETNRRRQRWIRVASWSLLLAMGTAGISATCGLVLKFSGEASIKDEAAK